MGLDRPVSAASRPMTVAEKYYAFLDLSWPMNPILSADLAVCPTPEEVEEKWRAFCSRRIYPRLMPTADLTIVDAGTSRVTFSAEVVPSADWSAALATVAGTEFGLERVMACHYVASPEEGRSRLYLLGHHSIVDGRGGLIELQAFLRFLDGQDVPSQDRLPVAGSTAARFPWQDDRRKMLEVLRDMSARNRELGPPLPASWPAADAARVCRGQPITFDADTSTALLGRAREEGVRVFSAMAAAWLVEVQRTVCGADQGTLQLNVPVDRSAPSDDPRRPNPMNVGVIGHRYRVSADEQWQLARDVASTVREAVDRGEGELFFELSRLEGVSDLAKGVEMVRAAIDAAPPAVSVTNMGLLDASGDPPWVETIAGNLPPTPNQVISFSTMGYRGQLCSTLWTDDLRIAPEHAVQLASGFRQALR